jgi:two-component sensor histidine kinase/PAS domain-containing protein
MGEDLKARYRRARRADLPFRARGLVAQVGVAVGLVAVATLIRMALGVLDPGIASFSLYFPAALLAALLAGWRGGAVATVLSTILAWTLFIRPRTLVDLHWSLALVNLALNTVSVLSVVALAGYVGRLVDRLWESQGALAQRNLDFDILFQTMSEGFALCEAIRDADGRLVDYLVLEMNPALQRMLGVGPDIIGGKLSDAGEDRRPWLDICDGVLTTGAPWVAEYYDEPTARWREVHVSRVTQTRMAQLLFDITDRKAAQARQAELFDEMNHRVKNNLAIVSSILHMQARGGDEALRAELMKAVARVQSIASVHESLYAGHSAQGVDFGPYLQNLCMRLAGSLLPDDRVRIVVDAEVAEMAMERAVSLGMIVNELVTNAVKYAYPAPAGGEIKVGFRVAEAGAVLTVRDWGVGLPGEFDGRGGGLGARLTRSMVRQLDATLTVGSGAPGAVFEIALPLSAPDSTSPA